MRKALRDPEPAKRWVAFLNNRREAIAAMDLFTVPTLTFGVLYCLFVISHDRRRILHFDATWHSSSAWEIQQLREAFTLDAAPGYLIFDAERWVGSCRRDLLDHVIVLNELHLKRLMSEYRPPKGSAAINGMKPQPLSKRMLIFISLQ
jgi:putative transposase